MKGLRTLASRAKDMPHDGGLRARAMRDLHAALSPDTVLALLDVVDAARAAWEANNEIAPDASHTGDCAHHDSLNPHWTGWERLRAALARLEASDE